MLRSQFVRIFHNLLCILIIIGLKLLYFLFSDLTICAFLLESGQLAYLHTCLGFGVSLVRAASILILILFNFLFEDMTAFSD